MPTKAIVAYETDTNDVFDLHFSMNGGDRFYLKPYLDHYLDGNLTKTLLGITPETPGELNHELADWVDAHERAVQPAPRSTDVSLQEIGQQIDFLRIEALYLVRESHVETYVPVWIYPDLLRAIREMVELTVYPLESFNHQTGIDQTARVVAEIAGDDLKSDSLENHRLRRFIEKNHQGIIQTVIGQIRDATSQADCEQTGLVMNEAIQIDPITADGALPGNRGRGVFIEVPYDDEADGPVDQGAVMTTGQVHRVAHARMLENSGVGPLSTDDRLRSELSIVAELIHRYGSRVAAFSPSPYDGYVDSYFDRLGVRATTDGSQYRVTGINGETLQVAEHASETSEQGGPLSTENITIKVHIQELMQSERAVWNRLSEGDIIRAVLDESGSTATLESISFEHHCPMVVSNADVQPDIIQKVYSASLGAENTGSDEQGFSGAKGVVPSVYESLSGDETAVAEVFLAKEPESEDQWESAIRGEMPIALSFAQFDGEPMEIIACNPPSVPYWYVLSFRFERTGLAGEVRNQLDAPYEPLTETLK